MEPSQVRTRILQDHEALRQQLSALEHAVAALLDDKRMVHRVAELAHQLLHELAEHTALEDSLLVPALTEIDAWGPVRADQLLEHHRAQRAQIRELTELFKLELNPGDVAHVTTSFVRELRLDMEHEERDLLSADLLRDDVIAVASFSG